MQIARFNSDAQIQERWGSSDEAGILQQIGATKRTSTMDQPPALTGATA